MCWALSGFESRSTAKAVIVQFYYNPPINKEITEDRAHGEQAALKTVPLVSSRWWFDSIIFLQIYVCSLKRCASNSSKSKHLLHDRRWRLETFWACQTWKIEVLGTKQLGKLFHLVIGDSSILLFSSKYIEHRVRLHRRAETSYRFA